MDLDKAIRLTIDSGKVIVGFRECIKSIINGNGKLVILANNIPTDTAKDIEYYSSMSNIPLLRYKGTSINLGEVCGFPYPVSVMLVLEEGDSGILNIVGSSEE